MSASNRRIKRLIGDVKEDRLKVRPFFQRRLVWTNVDKENFIDTVLMDYPFPEIFVASDTVDRARISGREWLVDGQQRITTLIDYFDGSKDILCKKVRPYSSLSEDEQARFLDYEVAVRDLGSVNERTIRDIFKRINSTDYALKSMEILNAMFSGAFNKYCEGLSRHPFFANHKVFPPASKKRMYDVTFCVILVTTMLAGYYRRDEKNAEYLEKYNDEFPQQDKVQLDLDIVFSFIDDCGFDEKSRAWKQTDLFTLLIELHSELVVKKVSLAPRAVGAALRDFFDRVDRLYSDKKLPDQVKIPAGQKQVFRYLKAATKATNDKYARIERAEVIGDVIKSTRLSA